MVGPSQILAHIKDQFGCTLRLDLQDTSCPSMYPLVPGPCLLSIDPKPKEIPHQYAMLELKF